MERRNCGLVPVDLGARWSFSFSQLAVVAWRSSLANVGRVLEVSVYVREAKELGTTDGVEGQGQWY